jgi:hypothetical protein
MTGGQAVRWQLSSVPGKYNRVHVIYGSPVNNSRLEGTQKTKMFEMLNSPVKGRTRRCFGTKTVKTEIFELGPLLKEKAARLKGPGYSDQAWTPHSLHDDTKRPDDRWMHGRA